MNYCTIADLIDQYGSDELIRLTDSTKPAASIDAAKTDRAIADASAEIDLYLHGRYKLPLAKVPAILKRLCGQLAFANLHPHDKAEKQAAHERAREARQTLKGIASNTLSIGLSAAGDAIEGGDTIRFAPGRNDWAGNW